MIKCKACQEEFQENKPWQKFCSTKCRRNYNNGSLSKDKAASHRQKPAAMLSRVKSRAKRQGIPFNLTIEDIVIPTHCPILGIELKWNRGRGYSPDSPSVDKIIPTLGYVKGNVQVISARANLLKNDAIVMTRLRSFVTSEELAKVLEHLREIDL